MSPSSTCENLHSSLVVYTNLFFLYDELYNLLTQAQKELISIVLWHILSFRKYFQTDYKERLTSISEFHKESVRGLIFITEVYVSLLVIRLSLPASTFYVTFPTCIDGTERGGLKTKGENSCNQSFLSF